MKIGDHIYIYTLHCRPSNNIEYVHVTRELWNASISEITDVLISATLKGQLAVWQLPLKKEEPYVINIPDRIAVRVWTDQFSLNPSIVAQFRECFIKECAKHGIIDDQIISIIEKS